MTLPENPHTVNVTSLAAHVAKRRGLERRPTRGERRQERRQRDLQICEVQLKHVRSYMRHLNRNVSELIELERELEARRERLAYRALPVIG